MNTMFRLLAFLTPRRARVSLAIALGCAAAAANLGLLSVAGYLIAAAALKPTLLSLSIPMYLVRFLGVSRAFVRYAERIVSHHVTLTLAADMRIWLFNRLEPLSPAVLARRRGGDVLARLVKDVDEIENVYLRVLSPALIALVTSGGVVILLFVFSPLLAVAAAVLFLAAGLGTPYLGFAIARPRGRRLSALRGDLFARIVDAVRGMQDLHIFGHTDRVCGQIEELEIESACVQRRLSLFAGLQAGLSELVAAVAMVAVVALATPLVAHGRIGGVYVAFLAVVTLSTFEVLQPLGVALDVLGRARAAGDRVFQIADSAPGIVELTAPVHPAGASCLEYRHVSLSYPGTSAPALDDVSFAVHPGMRVAVVGASGSGKSSLVHLALRFWDPSGGVVAMAGADVRACAIDDVRSRIGVVMQDVSLFTDTLRNNLRIGKPDAADAEVRDALCAVELHGLLDRLPSGLDSWINEQGLQLSGGERQRLAIARALLKDAPILMLDEPTANLDPLTEESVMRTLFERTRDKAVLLVTHRLVSMDRMDEIIVMDRGQIVERGAHAQLVAAGGAYCQLLDAQDQVFGLA